MARRVRVALLAVLALLSAGLVALPGSLGKAAAATTTEVYFEKSGAYHQSRFDALAPAGYRMTSLSVYGPSSSPLYAVTWLKKSGPAWSATHGVSAASWDSQVTSQAANGFYPSIASATGSSALVFAGVFEQFTGTGIKPVTKRGLSMSTFRSWNDSYQKQGYSLRWVDLYGTSTTPSIVAAWWPRVTTASKTVRESNSIDATATDGTLELTPASGVQAQADAMAKQGMRLDLMADNGTGNRLMTWRDDYYVGGYITYVGMTAAQYQTKVNELSAQGGWFPIHVDAGGTTAANSTYNALWVVNPSIAPRVFTTTNKGGAANSSFDNYMKTLMSSIGAREASLAITRGGKLIYARGYGWTEAGGSVAQPDRLMRIASCSKPITSIAIQQLAEGGLARSTKAYPYVYAGTTTATNKTVTVDELLYHAGGQVNGPSGNNAMFDDIRIASDLGISLPINKDHVMQRMATLSSEYTPGTDSRYSNYGYSLLGQVIEQRTGLTYGTAIKNKVLTPLGITKMKLGSTAYPSSEPRYEPNADRVESTWNSVYLARNLLVSSASAPMVGWPYGGFNMNKMDSHGQWVGSAVDLARIQAAFDAPNNPLFSFDTTSESALSTRPSASTYPSLSGSAYDNTFRGYFRTKVPKNGGGTHDLVGHNGGLSGTACLMAHRDDGLTFSVLMNRDPRGLLQLGNHGKALSDIANTISVWPTTDLFPAFGMSSF